MAYLSIDQIAAIGFRRVGRNVLISDKASIYSPELMEIGDNSRIDDYCVVSGRVTIGRRCLVTAQCLIAGGRPGIVLSDFATLSYGVKVFSQSDDYSGMTMTNSLVSRAYKSEILKPVNIGHQVIIGAGSVVFPGADVAEGCAIGAMTLVTQPTQPWGIYAGIPARRLKDRSRELLKLEKKFLAEVAENSL